MSRQLGREDYTIGWVCGLPVELAAAKALLDEEHDDLEHDLNNDENLYALGSIGGHNVAIVCLPAGRIGNNPAAVVATQMRATFKGIRFGLIVGIGGGVPSAEVDIRLGDVVVSQPHQNFGGVVQYDMGKTTPSGFERIGSLNSPPQLLLNAINKVQANRYLRRSTLSDYVSKLERTPCFQRRITGPDVLFEAAYDHEGGNKCEQCNTGRQQTRPQRESKEEIVVHYGTIASGNQVMTSGAERDKISAKLGGVLCFEQEAAGLMNSFPCLVIRGICDYADSHKNNQWQAYAAGTAAAYGKEVLSVIPAAKVMETHPAEEVMETHPTKEAMHSASKRSLPSRSLESAPVKRKRLEISDGPENNITEQQIVPLPNHHQNLSQTTVNEEQKKGLLESLKFDQIESRQMNIRNAYAKTCRWLLRHPEYLNWLDVTKLGEHHGFLWIRGNPGTGKSTLMKFALTNSRKMMKDYIVLSFFFNARGEDVEKSTVGTYRSLLLQLLQQLPGLHSILSSSHLSAASSSIDYQWSIELLKMLLEQAITSLGESSVVCFIDALDECEEEQVRDMIQFFESIGELAVANGIRFQTCFSSRHYPHITIRKGLILVLERQEGHSQDITNYIKRELRIKENGTAQKVRAELQEKASGIFMWVVLVVGILNKESDRGRIHTLYQKLREIPSDLHDLFHDILLRDTHNKDSLVLCIQWVLFAKQPLAPEQLYYAMLSKPDRDAVSKLDPKEISEDVIRLFILDSSKGLAEATASKVPKVQFIHESVRDFLLKEKGLSKIWPELGSNFQGQSHERLKHCCLDYMNAEKVKAPGIPGGLSKASSPPAAGIFHFLEYAVRNVLYHADAAEGGGVSQVTFLGSFSLSQWVILDNLFEKHTVRRHKERVSFLYILAELNMANLIKAQSLGSRCLEVENERYGCPLFAAIATRSKEAAQACIEGLEASQSTCSDDRGRYEEFYDEERARKSLGRGFIYSRKRGMLSYAAEFGHESMVKWFLYNGAEVDARNGKYGNALWAASERGHEQIVRLLVDSGADVNAQGGKYGSSALYEASLRGHEQIVQLLVDSGAVVNPRGGNSALQAASRGGHEQIVRLLVDSGADVNAQAGEYGSRALQAASRGGHEQIVRLLVDSGADVNAQGGEYGSSALYAASLGGHEQIVRLLVDSGADVNAQGGEYGSSALYAASLGGHEQIVQLLIDSGADVNTKNRRYGSALYAASGRGHEQIVRLLVDLGANVNVQGGKYCTALCVASLGGYEQIVQLLVNSGADVNAQWKNGSSALYAASLGGHEQIVQLLIDSGADDNKGGEFSSALHAASEKGHEQVVKLLVNSGADVNAQGEVFGSALRAASERGHEQVVKLLVNSGADVNAQDEVFGSALQAASARGHEQFVKLLVDLGADVNAQDEVFGSALQAASEEGHEQVVKLLVDLGADVNAQHEVYGSALYAASERGHEQIVRLLIDLGANVNAQGGEYGSALNVASESGHEDIVDLLIGSGAHWSKA